MRHIFFSLVLKCSLPALFQVKGQVQCTLLSAAAASSGFSNSALIHVSTLCRRVPSRALDEKQNSVGFGHNNLTVRRYLAALWCGCKNSKTCTAVSPAVLPLVSETKRASRWRICGKSGTANFHCLLCTSTPRGWSPPICFTFLSVLFMEHKYYMTISKIKGANFRLEA